MAAKRYRQFGWGILVASVLVLVELHLKAVWALLTLPAFPAAFKAVFALLPPYRQILAIGDTIFRTLLAFWGIGIGFRMIRRGYTQHLRYLMWAFAAWEAVHFFLATFAGQFLVFNVVTAVIALYLLLGEGLWPRLIRGERDSPLNQA